MHHSEIKVFVPTVITFGFAETVIAVSEDVGLAQIGLRITNIPDISTEYANANFGYVPVFSTVDTNDSAVGMSAQAPLIAS